MEVFQMDWRVFHVQEQHFLLISLIPDKH